MNKLPTDLEILNHIYETYSDEFSNQDLTKTNRCSVIYIPIDIKCIAKSLETDPHLLFGRLYYHLDHKYRYKQEEGSQVHMFAFQVGEDRHCINYPYLAAILSEKRTEEKRSMAALLVSLLSLGVAIAALIIKAR